MTELAETEQHQEPPPVDKTHTFPFTIEEAMDDSDSETLKNRLVVLDRSIMSVNDEKKKANKDFADRLKVLTGEHAQVLGSIELGTVKREVLCYEERDDRLHRILTRRVDTDAIVDERPLEDDDEGPPPSATRQTDLFDGGTTPEETAAVAEAEGRVVRTTSAAARRRAEERKAAGETEPAGEAEADDESDLDDIESGDDAEEDDETE